jgi:hypothetical protein
VTAGLSVGEPAERLELTIRLKATAAKKVAAMERGSPFLIAIAMAKPDRVVITKELSKPSKQA